MGPLIAGLLAGLPSLIQGGIGVAQYAKGNKDANNNERPNYNIPGEINEVERIARMLAGTNYLPGESLTRNAETEALAGGIKNAVGAAGSGVDALAAISGMVGHQSRSENQRAVARADRSDRMDIMLQQVLEKVATYKDKAWELNKLNPYMDKAASSSAMMGAGIQNAVGGLDGMASAYLSSMLPKVYENANAGGASGAAPKKLAEEMATMPMRQAGAIPTAINGITRQVPMGVDIHTPESTNWYNDLIKSIPQTLVQQGQAGANSQQILQQILSTLNFGYGN